MRRNDIYVIIGRFNYLEDSIEENAKVTQAHGRAPYLKNDFNVVMYSHNDFYVITKISKAVCIS